VVDRQGAGVGRAHLEEAAGDAGGAQALEAGGDELARAAAAALAGVQKEAQSGQRTTIDVLNALQDHVSARARLVQAQRDRVVASYSLLFAVGRLDMETLGLSKAVYQPEEHYLQVRDSWIGLRIPSGQ